MAVEGVTIEEAGAIGRLRDRSQKIRERITYESGNYPYVTARVRAKRAALLPADTYARLLQMQIPEIARFLGEREYKSEMVALGGRYAGVDLIEHATALNLTRTYNQIDDFLGGPRFPDLLHGTPPIGPALDGRESTHAAVHRTRD